MKIEELFNKIYYNIDRSKEYFYQPKCNVMYFDYDTQSFHNVYSIIKDNDNVWYINFNDPRVIKINGTFQSINLLSKDCPDNLEQVKRRIKLKYRITSGGECEVFNFINYSNIIFKENLSEYFTI
jgi:hypothetical protein